MTKDEAIKEAIKELERWRREVRKVYSSNGKWMEFAINDGTKARYDRFGEVVKAMKREE